MTDIIKQAELAIMEGYMLEATNLKFPKSEFIEEFKTLPKANHVDSDYLALKWK